jgi:hypothetical protein
MIIVSGPYSSPDKELKKARTKCIAEVCVKLMAQGASWYDLNPQIAVSPLLSGLAILEKSEMVLPDSYEFWNEFCRSFVRAADSLFIINLDGWETSGGVTDEIKVAKECNISIYLIDSELNFVKKL